MERVQQRSQGATVFNRPCSRLVATGAMSALGDKWTRHRWLHSVASDPFRTLLALSAQPKYARRAIALSIFLFWLYIG
jgi:hypothetical protein